MLDTFDSISRAILLRNQVPGLLLAQDFVKNAFRRIAETRRWTWLMKNQQILVPQLYNTGTANVTYGSPLVTGQGTTWTPDMVGRQFRVGSQSPIYDIAQIIGPTSLLLSLPWAGNTPALFGVTYNIYQCFFPTPSDFHAFLTVIDPLYNWQLNLNIDQREINAYDAQRSNFQQAYVVSYRDTSLGTQGILLAPVQVAGTGPAPIVGGTYSNPSNGIFLVQITTGGALGAAQFSWSKNGGVLSTPANCQNFPPGNRLSDGTIITFPAATYVAGDQFVIQAQAGTQVGVPRYELWPQNQQQYVYPYQYESRAQDISDGGTLPQFIRGDVLLEMCMGDLAAWPGTVDQPNPSFNLALSQLHHGKAAKMIEELERQDDEVWVQSVQYDISSLPYAPLPWGDSSWLQSHAF